MNNYIISSKFGSTAFASSLALQLCDQFLIEAILIQLFDYILTSVVCKKLASSLTRALPNTAGFLQLLLDSSYSNTGPTRVGSYRISKENCLDRAISSVYKRRKTYSYLN